MAYRTHIRILDDKSLLQIFSYYRLEEEDSWNLRVTWRKLAHICRRWRYLIFDSSFHLDMRLLLTNNSPSLDTLSHLPPIPLVIDYSDASTTITQKDEDNIHLGLQQPGRVRQFNLRASSSSLHMLYKSMNQLFSTLENLSLLSTTDEMSLVLPETFQAPDLRHLSLHGIGLSLPLLPSAIDLSTLSLTHIRDPSFSPRLLVTQLQGLPHLEELSIEFATPVSLPSSKEDLLLALDLPVTLLTLRLRRFTFRGLDVYLDRLVAQIDAPLLEQLTVTLFFDVTFNLVNLTQFVQRTEGVRCLVSRVIFNKDGVLIDAGDYKQQDFGKQLSLHVHCEPLDWQLDSATQVCGAFLPAIEELSLDLDEDGIPSDWEDTLDSIMWHEFLLPFIGVTKLHIGYSLILELSRALGSVGGGLDLELLPELQEVGVQFEINHAKDLFSLFIETRESLGRPVHLLALPIPYAEPRVFPRYMKYVSPTPVRCDTIKYLTGLLTSI